ncbi:MAG: methyltransferase [Parabacteroides sp.]|nr:methyltransferase [Parabacteroides sp.]
MSNPFFQFKQFTIRHDKCAMKVGTDGVLLGAWAGTDSCNRILDIGTGTGLIALMLAQRSPAIIDAIDIDADACLQAQENVVFSPFAERIQVRHSALADFAQAATDRYDLIVSNPPYFVDSLKCPDRQRNTARHTDTLTLEDLLQDSRKLLASQGRIALILPYDQKERLTDCIRTYQLFLSKETSVIPVPGAQPKRLLAELTADQPASPASSDRLILEIARHQYTDEYIRLTKDFYLKM